MLRRVRNLFERYLVDRRILEAPGRHLIDPDGAVLGHVDKLVVVGARLQIHGWTTVDRVRFVQADTRRAVRPDLPREDARHFAGAGARGFVIDVAWTMGPAQLVLYLGEARYVFEISVPGLWPTRVAKLRHVPGFCVRMALAAPAILSWLVFRPDAARQKIKAQLAPHGGERVGALGFPKGVPSPRLPEPRTAIVVPVYNALDDLRDCLSAVRRNTRGDWRLILIDDASPEAGVRPYLRAWTKEVNAASPGRVILLENDENLGFIGSVNRGLEAARKMRRDVVLLNSDAMVPPNWDSRLLEPIQSDRRVASVTPMSNDAEIFSAPVICKGDLLDRKIALKIDEVARRLPRGGCADAPTGVGFCMALNREFLRRIPRLDTAFGRGYGEEVDWCQKAARLGGRHVAQPRLFVHHRSGASFGQELKSQLVHANNRKISARYPTYDAEVAQFISMDPLLSYRLSLGIARYGAVSRKPLPVYLAHSWGGGAELYLRNRIAGDLRKGGAALVVRVGGRRRWAVELHCDGGCTKGHCDDFETVAALVGAAEHRHVIYSCGVGDQKPVELPAYLTQLIGGQSGEVLVHDYFMVSPSYHLLDREGLYRGLSDLEVAVPDEAGVAPQKWREAWGGLLKAVDHVTVFSQSSRDILSEAYPGIASKIRCRPHSILTKVPRIARRPGAPPVVGILGNLNRHKGAKVASGLADTLSRTGVRTVVLGDVDPSLDLSPKLEVQGGYDLRDLPEIVRRSGISCWVIPSIWPETFSYTTHECLATGLPVFVFDIGAQAEAAAAAENGTVVPFGAPEMHVANLCDALDAVLQHLDRRAVA